jgi:hypothetical protein
MKFKPFVIIKLFAKFEGSSKDYLKLILLMR